MRTDSVIRYEAMELLLQNFGMVDSARFVTMVKRDAFDYTEWRRDLWDDMTIGEVHADATAYESANT